MNIRFKWLFLILLFAVPVYSQNVRVDNVAFSSVQGFPFLPLATITVCTAVGAGQPCSPTVAGLCSTISDTTCSQPATFTSDALGNFGFWIQPGSYTYTVTKAGFGGFGPKALTLSCQPSSTCTVTGPQTSTSTTIDCTLNTVKYVDSANTCGWAGADFGANMNAACTALNVGGKINVDGGSRNFTTPIICIPTGNPITIEGPSEENSVWNYTPTTGIAVTFSGSNGGNGGAGIRNVTIKGAGSANVTVGLHLGSNAVGIAGGYFPAMTIRGFGTGLEFNSTGTGFLNTFVSPKIQFNGTGIKLSGEDGQFFGGLVGNNGVGVTDPAAGEATFSGTAFDDNTTQAFNETNSSSAIYCVGCRYENSALGTDNYITISAGYFTQHGGQMVDDITTGTTTGLIQQSGGSLSIWGTSLKSGGRTVTQLDNISGSAIAVLHPIIQNVAQFPSLFTAAYTGGGVEASALMGSAQNIAGITFKASQPFLTLDDSVDSGGAWQMKAIASNPGNGCVGVAGLDILQTGGQRLNFCTGGISIFGSGSGSSGIFAPASGGTANTLTSTTLANVAGSVIPLQCVTSQKTESAADANVLTCTPPTIAGNYRLQFVISLSAANTATLGWTATWTDSNGTSQAPTNLPICISSAGTCAATTGALSTTSTASGNYVIDVNNAGTAIVLKLTFSGTSFTAKVSATVERII